MKKIFLIVFCFGAVLACKEEGTDTGNPSYSTSVPDCGVARCLQAPYVKMEVAAICQKLNHCFAVDPWDCQNRVYEQAGLASEIPIKVDSFKELDNLYSQNKVKVDDKTYSSCTQSIDGLSCDSSIMQNSIGLGETLDYSNVHIILQADSSCKGIYIEED